MNKYGAKKASCLYGHTHDSRKEARRCNELHLLQKAGAIKDLEAQIKALKAEEDALKARRGRKTDTIDRLTEWLKMALNGQRFETARCDVRFRRSTAVKVLDVGAIPREYMRYKPAPDPEPDKAKIKKALLEGAKIAGVGLTEGLSCTVK